MSIPPIIPNSELICANCGKLGVLSQELIDRISINSFPNRQIPVIFETDLMRFKCIQCNEKQMKLKPRDVHLPQVVKNSVESIESTEYQIITKYLNQTTLEEQRVLLAWANGLQTIKHAEVDTLEKAKRAIMLTVNSGAIQPFLAFLGIEIKRVGWDERGLPERMALSAAAAAALLFSGQGAGIAALGGAIGVPLWVVFGAGGAFVGVLIKEVQRRIAEDETKNKDGH